MKNPLSPTSGLLAVDSASPIVSVAFGSPSEVLAQRAIEISHSSEALLRSIEEVLSAAGAELGDVEGLIGLRGPGSFTGLRVGLATLLGLHQGLNIPAMALPSLEVLSLAAPPGRRRVAGVVDALRGEWFAQMFVDSQAETEAAILAPAQIENLRPDCVVGHGIDTLRQSLPPEVDLVEARELAPLALRLVGLRELTWSPATLLDPLYLRAPAIHRQG